MVEGLDMKLLSIFLHQILVKFLQLKSGKNYLTSNSLICLIFAVAVPTFPTTLAAAALANLEETLSLVFAYATDSTAITVSLLQ